MKILDLHPKLNYLLRSAPLKWKSWVHCWDYSVFREDDTIHNIYCDCTCDIECGIRKRKDIMYEVLMTYKIAELPHFLRGNYWKTHGPVDFMEHNQSFCQKNYFFPLFQWATISSPNFEVSDDIVSWFNCPVIRMVLLVHDIFAYLKENFLFVGQWYPRPFHV